MCHWIRIGSLHVTHCQRCHLNDFLVVFVFCNKWLNHDLLLQMVAYGSLWMHTNAYECIQMHMECFHLSLLIVIGFRWFQKDLCDISFTGWKKCTFHSAVGKSARPAERNAHFLHRLKELQDWRVSRQEALCSIGICFHSFLLIFHWFRLISEAFEGLGWWREACTLLIDARTCIFVDVFAFHWFQQDLRAWGREACPLPIEARDLSFMIVLISIKLLLVFIDFHWVQVDLRLSRLEGWAACGARVLPF